MIQADSLIFIGDFKPPNAYYSTSLSFLSLCFYFHLFLKSSCSQNFHKIFFSTVYLILKKSSVANTIGLLMPLLWFRQIRSFPQEIFTHYFIPFSFFLFSTLFQIFCSLPQHFYETYFYLFFIILSFFLLILTLYTAL